MSEEDESYTQPQKKKARATVLSHAVKSLAEKRASSPLATVAKFRRLAKYCVEFIKQHAKVDLTAPMSVLQEAWKAVHTSRVGRRAPSDLKVLFLCGPEPLNDLQELVALG